MKVYIVMGNEGKGIYKVYTNKEKAKEAAHYAEWCAGMAGSNAIYWVEEHETEE